MILIIILATVSSLAAVWFGLQAHDLKNAVDAAEKRNSSMHYEILQVRAERTVAEEKTRKILRELRTDPSNPYYVPPVTPQVARRKKSAGSSRGNSGSSSSNSGSSRGDDGSTAAIIATTAAVASFSGYDSGSSYCDSGSSSFDSGCSF